MDHLRHLKAFQNCIGSEEENAKIPMIYGKLDELAEGGSARAVKEQIRYVTFNTHSASKIFL